MDRIHLNRQQNTLYAEVRKRRPDGEDALAAVILLHRHYRNITGPKVN